MKYKNSIYSFLLAPVPEILFESSKPRRSGAPVRTSTHQSIHQGDTVQCVLTGPSTDLLRATASRKN